MIAYISKDKYGNYAIFKRFENLAEDFTTLNECMIISESVAHKMLLGRDVEEYKFEQIKL